jgi:hypothetical protein
LQWFLLRVNGYGRAMACELALVYKYYPFDPTEHALLAWIRKVVPDTVFFEFPADARRDPVTDTEADPGFLAFLRENRPKQVWVWNNLLTPRELAECKSAGAKVAALMNSFAVYHGGHFPDQAAYIAHNRNLDAYFVPHYGNVAPLRAQGINAVEMPFFYDQRVYKPLSGLLVPGILKNIQVLFIGSVSESAASNRRILIEALGKRLDMHVVTFKDPRLPGVTWHRATNRPFVLNWWKNRSHLILNIEDVGDTYSPEVLNARFCTTDLRYSERKVFHGNHVIPAMGAGRICLSEWSEPLLRFCEPGTDILVWKTPAEATEVALEILGNPSRLRSMQEAAYQKAISKHTAEIRIRQILQEMSGVSRA